VDAAGQPDERLMTQRADYGVQKELDYVFVCGASVVSKVVDRCKEPDAKAPWQQVSDHAALVVEFDTGV
jgi:endonuclease/exonuclease/phosphatase family metal-dependent hydrolase